MQTWRRRLADSLRLAGVALMIAGAVVATYLEWTGVLDFALLPYFLAFATYCVVEIIATVVGSEGNLFTGGRPHLGK